MLAQIKNPLLSPTLQGKSGVGFFQSLISSLLSLVLVAGLIIFSFMLLIGGIQWATSGGDKAALEGARGRIVHALIGIVVMLSAFGIIKAIEAFFGIDILILDIGPLKIK